MPAIQYVEEYKIITSTSGLDSPLVQTVNEMILGGWVPIGGPSVLQDDNGDVTMYQGMVKLKDRRNDT